MNPTMRFVHVLELLRLIGRKTYLRCWSIVNIKGTKNPCGEVLLSEALE
jgi:hypothetical protein